MPLNKNSYCLIITGPTASGKTDLSLKVSENISSEIINADVGQFYEKLSVGTAKIDWKNQKIPHHLFDIIKQPENLDCFNYRKMVFEKIEEITSRKNLPIIVGGSQFYLRSIFFPPHKNIKINENKDVDYSWEFLNKLDSERAEKIDSKDTYRIQRAIDICLSTGKQSSELEPEFELPLNVRIIFIEQNREQLYEKINLRTDKMIKEGGWVKEVENLKNSDWEKFLKIKKLIGYSEILDWIEKGEKNDIDILISEIQKKTRNYAKRQITFLKKFRSDLEAKNLEQEKPFCRITTIDKIDEIDDLVKLVKKDLKD